MRITRNIEANGKSVAVEIELTPAELSLAYNEQEHLYDVQNVRNHISSGVYDDDDNEITFSDDEIDVIAFDTRYEMDRHESSFEYAVGIAIDKALADRK